MSDEDYFKYRPPPDFLPVRIESSRSDRTFNLEVRDPNSRLIIVRIEIPVADLGRILHGSHGDAFAKLYAAAPDRRVGKYVHTRTIRVGPVEWGDTGAVIGMAHQQAEPDEEVENFHWNSNNASRTEGGLYYHHVLLRSWRDTPPEPRKYPPRTEFPDEIRPKPKSRRKNK